MMLRRTGLLCVVLAMFAIAGGPWAVLQTVAWGEMLRDYCQRGNSFTVAVMQTFDGEHPCDLCRQIALAKSQGGKERPTTSVSTWAKTDGKVKALPTPFVFQGKWQERPLPHVVTRWIGRQVSRAEAPPTPPPRRADSAV